MEKLKKYKRDKLSYKKTAYTLIKEAAFFADFNDDEANLLADWVKAYTAEAGCVILTEGQKENNLYFLLQGAANIYKKLPNDEHIKVAEINASEPIGEMNIIDGEPFSASVIAAEESILLLITSKDFNTITKKDLQLTNKLLWSIARVLVQRLRQGTSKILLLNSEKSN